MSLVVDLNHQRLSGSSPPLRHAVLIHLQNNHNLIKLYQLVKLYEILVDISDSYISDISVADHIT